MIRIGPLSIFGKLWKTNSTERSPRLCSPSQIGRRRGKPSGRSVMFLPQLKSEQDAVPFLAGTQYPVPDSQTFDTLLLKQLALDRCMPLSLLHIEACMNLAVYLDGKLSARGLDFYHKSVKTRSPKAHVNNERRPAHAGLTV